MKRLSYLLFLTYFIYSCDDLNNSDIGPTFDFEITTSPETPIVLNPTLLIDDSPTNVIPSEEPSRGTLEVVSERNFITYAPSASFRGGSDSFSLNMIDDRGNQTLRNVVVRVDEDFEAKCEGHGGGYAFYRMRPGEEIMESGVQNEVFCGSLGIGSSSINYIEVDVPENAGEPEIHLNSGVQVIYAAPEDFQGFLTFIYEVGNDCSSRSEEVGPKRCKNYYATLVTIEVSNEQ